MSSSNGNGTPSGKPNLSQKPPVKLTTMVTSKFLSNSEDLGVVAVGFSGGQCKPGVDAAPAALIESGLLTQLHEELGYRLHGHDTVHLYRDLAPASDPEYRNMKKPLAASPQTRPEIGRAHV